MKKIDPGDDSKNSMRSCGAPQPVVLQFCNGIIFFFLLVTCTRQECRTRTESS
jgi:hypothetical protein